ncbi:MAG: hypothetical protein ACK53L_30150, partial [Pirellulaceae bacterium]
APDCAAIHDVLRVCNTIEDDANCRGKTDLKWIVSMLTRWIQRTKVVSEERIEHEKTHGQPMGPKCRLSVGDLR